MNVEDLEILVSFLGMISADLALLLIRKERELITQQSNQTGVQSSIGTLSGDEAEEDIDTTSSRSLKSKKVKKIKRMKRKRK